MFFKCLVHSCLRKSTGEIDTFKTLEKRRYFPQWWSEKGLKSMLAILQVYAFENDNQRVYFTKTGLFCFYLITVK